MLPSHKRFRGKDLRVTDPTELDNAESKLTHLAQMETFPVELKKHSPLANLLRIVVKLPHTRHLLVPLVSFVPPDGSCA